MIVQPVPLGVLRMRTGSASLQVGNYVVVSRLIRVRECLAEVHIGG